MQAFQLKCEINAAVWLRDMETNQSTPEQAPDLCEYMPEKDFENQMTRHKPDRRTMGKNRTEDVIKRVRKEKVAVTGPHTQETIRKHHKAIIVMEPSGS